MALNTDTLLTQPERDVLTCTELNVKKSADVVAEETGYSVDEVHACLERLTKNKIIEPRVFVNWYAAGFNQFIVYFETNPFTRVDDSKLVELLIDSKSHSWVATLDGPFQAAIAVRARRINEVANFLNEFSLGHKEWYRKKAVGGRVVVTFFGRKYLSDTISPSTPLTSGYTNQPTHIDETDSMILSAIESDPVSCLENGKGIGSLALSPRMIAKRIQALRENNILKDWYYAVDFRRIGITHYKLLLTAKEVSPHLRDELYWFAKEHKHVIGFREYVGDWDYAMDVEAFEATTIGSVTESIAGRFGSHLRTVTCNRVLNYAGLSLFC